MTHDNSGELTLETDAQASARIDGVETRGEGEVADTEAGGEIPAVDPVFEAATIASVAEATDPSPDPVAEAQIAELNVELGVTVTGGENLAEAAAADALVSTGLLEVADGLENTVKTVTEDIVEPPHSADTENPVTVTGAGIVEAAVVGAVAVAGVEKAIEAIEKEPIDVIALNNKIVHMPYLKRAEAIANLSEEEISAIAKHLLVILHDGAGESFDRVYSMITTFNKSERILEQPETVEALKSIFTNTRIHLYNVGGIINLPGIGEKVLADSEVRNAIIESTTRFFSNYDDKSSHESGLRIVDEMKLSALELRAIAEGLKGKGDAYTRFVRHFGALTIYPELR